MLDNLGIIILKGFEDRAEMLNDEICKLTGENKNYIINIENPRFSNGEAKVQIKETVRDKEIFIIGGGEIYKELLPYCHRALVTKVDAVGGAEVFFPNLDKDESFVCIQEGEPIQDNGYTIRFTTYENKAVKSL